MSILRQILPPRVTRQQAHEIARGVVPDVDAGLLSWYPLCGVILRADVARGPAKRLDGQLLYAAVDRATGEAFTTDPWSLEQHSVVQTEGIQPKADYRLSVDDAVVAARKAVSTALMRRVRLAARFELRRVEVIDPLWKPNWYFVGVTRRVLVDGLTGDFVVVRRE